MSSETEHSPNEGDLTIQGNSPNQELSLIQGIITIQEEICFKYFGWALGLVTAISIGYAHNSVEVSSGTYLTSGLVILLSCAFSARKHHVAQRKLILRFSEVELQIGKKTYCGFAIDAALKKISPPQ